MGCLSLAILIGTLVVSVNGHGRLMDPPARNSMWRFGYPNPINYNDNEVFCGGFGVQFDKNGGKCGVCGDNWAEKTPRLHEAGGKFGNGLIGKRFVTGQRMPVEIDLTTNHWGYFELKLCPNNNKKEIVNQKCLDKYPLEIADKPGETKFYIPEGVGKSEILNYEVMLPKGVTCNQCVIQWTYTTGNTWGECKNGTEAVGCGAQEMFRNCADIQIYSNTVGIPPNAIDNPNAIYFRDKSAKGGRRMLVNRYQVCEARGYFRHIPDADNWCQTNCLSYPARCPKHLCGCIKECHAIGRLANVEGTDVYCHRNCINYPPECPKDRCQCEYHDEFYEDTSDEDPVVEAATEE